MAANLSETFSLILLLVFSLIAGINGLDGSTALVSTHIPDENPPSDFDYKSYLKRFGYIGYAEANAGKRNPSEQEVLELALKKFQTFFKIEPTGIFDAQTYSMMTVSRCGNPDVYPTGGNSMQSSDGYDRRHVAPSMIMT